MMRSNNALTLVGVLLLALQCQPGVKAAEHEPKVAKLKREFGIHLKLPADWKETPIGVIGPKGAVFAFIWNPPGRDDEGEPPQFQVNVFPGPAKSDASAPNMFVYSQCDRFPDRWSEQIASCCTPLELRTGKALKTASVVSRIFTDAEQKRGGVAQFAGCQLQAAYMHPDGVVEAGANLFTDNYTYIIRVTAPREEYLKLSPKLVAILDSLRVRCSHGWCNVD